MTNKLRVDSAFVEVTSKCNLKCMHCYNESGFSNDEKIDISKLINQLQQLKCKTIIITGGEPFTLSNILEIIDISSTSFDKVKIVTNGLLLNEKIVKKIKNINSNIQFQVSIDGTSREEHDAIRGKGNFDKAMEAIKILCRYGYKVNVHLVLMKNNHSYLASFISLIDKMSINEISFGFLNQFGRAEYNQKRLKMSSNDYIETYRTLKMLSLDAIIQNISIELSAFEHINFGCTLLEDIFEEIHIKNIRINSSGDTFFCQRFYKKEHSIGSIDTEIVDKVKVNSLINAILKSVSTNKKCNKCFYQDFCEKPCPALMINDSSKYSDNLCEIRKINFFNY